MSCLLMLCLSDVYDIFLLIADVYGTFFGIICMCIFPFDFCFINFVDVLSSKHVIMMFCRRNVVGMSLRISLEDRCLVVAAMHCRSVASISYVVIVSAFFIVAYGIESLSCFDIVMSSPSVLLWYRCCCIISISSIIKEHRRTVVVVFVNVVSLVFADVVVIVSSSQCCCYVFVVVFVMMPLVMHRQ